MLQKEDKIRDLNDQLQDKVSVDYTCACSHDDSVNQQQPKTTRDQHSKTIARADTQITTNNGSACCTFDACVSARLLGGATGPLSVITTTDASNTDRKTKKSPTKFTRSTTHDAVSTATCVDDLINIESSMLSTGINSTLVTSEPRLMTTSPIVPADRKQNRASLPYAGIGSLLHRTGMSGDLGSPTPSLPPTFIGKKASTEIKGVETSPTVVHPATKQEDGRTNSDPDVIYSESYC